MSSQKDLFEELQRLYLSEPNRLRIIEEQIDLDLQSSYFKRSAMLKKAVLDLDEILAKLPVLYDVDARLEEKRDILVSLALIDDVQAFRTIETFKNVAEGEIKMWAIMAYRQSKMLIESSLLDEDQILISTGLGGKDCSFRYFICFMQKDEKPLSEIQQKILSSELKTALEKYHSELETLTFCDQFAKVFALVPLNIAVKNMLDEVLDACQEFGNFLADKVIVTNVRQMTDEEIGEFFHNEIDENDMFDIDDFPFEIDDSGDVEISLDDLNRFSNEDFDEEDDDEDFDDDDDENDSF